MKEGKLIVFEGLDKSGKETQARMLVEYLKKKGYEAIYEDEPTSSNPVGRLIKRWLSDEEEINSGEAITLLYVADRYEHLKTRVMPALKSGKVVVLDRYYYSTIAYQSSLYGVDDEWIEQLHRFVLKPELVIYLDVSPEECMRRAEKMGEKDRHERLEVLKRVRDAYEKLKDRYNFRVVNGERSKEEVFEEVKGVVSRYTGL